MKFLENWRKSLDKQAAKTTRRIIKRALTESRTPRKIRIDVYGAERQRAFMMVGWSPLSDSAGKMTLEMELPVMEWGR